MNVVIPDFDSIIKDINTPANVIVADHKIFYISYLKYPNELTKMLDEQICNMNGKSKDNVGRSETAICIREPWKCLILYGDHSEAYKALGNDLKACIEYWKKHPELMGDTSDSAE